MLTIQTLSTCSRHQRTTQVFPLLHQLQRLKAPERIQFTVVVLTFKCLHGTAPSPCLANEFLRSWDLEAGGCFRSAAPASSSSLIVRRVYTVVDRRRQSFTDRGCSCLETCLPRHVRTVWQSSKDSSFRAAHFPNFCNACELTYVIIGQFNRFCYTYLITRPETGR